ncbi:hypothetical protein [Ruegeria sp.]|uniref:hypothetical protein n=1 Tax=Ruegeria sp. TaxID=1879320 RepID=UPI003C7B1E2E
MMETADPTCQTPTSQLAAAVIVNALLDLLNVAGATSQLNEKDKRDTIAFLTNKAGEWAQSRRDWCDMAGLREAQLRQRVVAFLEGNDALLAAMFDVSRPRGDKAKMREKGAAQSRAIWREMNSRPPAPKRIKRPDPQPVQLPRIKKTLTQDVLLHALKDESLTIRQLVFATDGDFDTTTIRVHLDRLQRLGLVEKLGPEWQVVPKLPVAACAG